MPPDWVSRYLAPTAGAGSSAVAGVVDLIDCEWVEAVGGPLARRLSGRVHRRRATPARPRRPTSGYGWTATSPSAGSAPLDRAEDIDLWTRLRAAGVAPRADADLVVGTSARTTGRVERGFAHALDVMYGAVDA